MNHSDRIARDVHLVLRDLVKSFKAAQPKDRSHVLSNIIAAAGSFMDTLGAVESGVTSSKRSHRVGFRLGQLAMDEEDALEGMNSGVMVTGGAIPGDLASRFVEEASRIVGQVLQGQQDDRIFSRRLKLLTASAELRASGDEAGADALSAEAAAITLPTPLIESTPPSPDQESPCPSPSSAPPSEEISA